MTDDPIKSAEINLPWLNRVLSEQLSNEITGYELQVIGEGVGVLGEIARLTLQLKDETTTTVICKFSAIMDGAREFARDLGYYETELSFYQSIARDMPVYVPFVYYQRMDMDTYRFVIVMEDMVGIAGDQVSGCSTDQAVQIVTELAKLHSRWNDPQQLDTLTWLRCINAPELIKKGMAETESSLPIYAERFPDLIPTWFDELRRVYPDTLLKLANEFNSKPHTLVHGDYRLDNFIFPSEGSTKPVAILDWQLAYRTMSSFDLGYFMFQSLDIELRRSQENLLIDTYVAGRNEQGDRSVTFDSIKSELGAVALYCYVYPIVGGALADLSKPRTRPLINAMSQRVIAAIEDYDSLRLLA